MQTLPPYTLFGLSLHFQLELDEEITAFVTWWNRKWAFEPYCFSSFIVYDLETFLWKILFSIFETGYITKANERTWELFYSLNEWNSHLRNNASNLLRKAPLFKTQSSNFCSRTIELNRFNFFTRRHQKEFKYRQL